MDKEDARYQKLEPLHERRKQVVRFHLRGTGVMFYLPSYSPELNHDERLNAHLKHAIGTKMPLRTKARLRAAADEHMNFIANPDRVRAYFHDPIVKYAARRLHVAGSDE